MTTYNTPKCGRCGQFWSGYGVYCNDCQRMNLLKEANRAQAETAENTARDASRAAGEAQSARQEQREHDNRQAQIAAFERSISKQITEEHNSAMESAAERQANAAEEVLRITRKAEWARTHPIRPTPKKIRKLANSKLIDNTTTLDEFIHIWNNTDAFWILLNAYQTANGNDDDLNLNDMYIEQGDIESAINLKRLLTEQEILEAMEDGRWDDAKSIKESRDVTVPDITTQQQRINYAAIQKARAEEIAAKKAEVARLTKLAARIDKLKSEWTIADAKRVSRENATLWTIYTVLFLMGCVFFGPWSTDWLPFKLVAVGSLYIIGCLVLIPFEPKPGTMPDFKSKIAEEA